MNTDFEEVRVTISDGSSECVKVFSGKLLSRKQVNAEGFEVVYRLYETFRGKLACVVRKNPAWQSSRNFDDEKWDEVSQDPKWWQPQYQLHIAASYEELEQQIGAKLVEALRNGVTPTKVEYLDI